MNFATTCRNFPQLLAKAGHQSRRANGELRTSAVRPANVRRHRSGAARPTWDAALSIRSSTQGAGVYNMRRSKSRVLYVKRKTPHFLLARTLALLDSQIFTTTSSGVTCVAHKPLRSIVKIKQPYIHVQNMDMHSTNIIKHLQQSSTKIATTNFFVWPFFWCSKKEVQPPSHWKGLGLESKALVHLGRAAVATSKANRSRWIGGCVPRTGRKMKAIKPILKNWSQKWKITGR